MQMRKKAKQKKLDGWDLRGEAQPVPNKPVHPADEILLLLRHFDELPLDAAHLCRQRSTIKT